MKTKLTHTLLRHISKEIQFGRPIWALLTLNEYLDGKCYLHKSLQKRARDNIRLEDISLELSAVISKILSGAKLIDLNETERNLALTYREISSESPFSGRNIPQLSYQRLRSSKERQRRFVIRS